MMKYCASNTVSVNIMSLFRAAERKQIPELGYIGLIFVSFLFKNCFLQNWSILPLVKFYYGKEFRILSNLLGGVLCLFRRGS